jgi:tetratricopeptide (TPR) repeat protein
LDPFERPWALGRQFYRERRFDDAIHELRSQIEIEPDVAELHGAPANAYYCKGMLKESIAEYEKFMTIRGDADQAATLDRIYKSAGYRATLEWRLDRLKKRAKRHDVSFMDLAELSAALGRRDEAVRYLREALDQRLPDLVFLKQDPYFDSLHSDPRYQAIVKRIGLL